MNPEREDSPSANELVVEQCQNMLTAAREGRILGHVCVLFLASGDLNVMVAGEQKLYERLGALEIARDGVKVFAAQEQAKRQHLAAMPAGGRA